MKVQQGLMSLNRDVGSRLKALLKQELVSFSHWSHMLEQKYGSSHISRVCRLCTLHILSAIFKSNLGGTTE